MHGSAADPGPSIPEGVTVVEAPDLHFIQLHGSESSLHTAGRLCAFKRLFHVLPGFAITVWPRRDTDRRRIRGWQSCSRYPSPQITAGTIDALLALQWLNLQCSLPWATGLASDIIINGTACTQHVAAYSFFELMLQPCGP